MDSSSHRTAITGPFLRAAPGLQNRGLYFQATTVGLSPTPLFASSLRRAMTSFSPTIQLDRFRPLLLFPIQQEIGERRIVDCDDLKRNTLLDDHPPQEQFHRLGHSQAEPAQHVLASTLDLGRHPHLERGTSDVAAHTPQYS